MPDLITSNQPQDSTLFARLKKLFSRDVIVRRIGGKELKVDDPDHLQSYMSNATRDRYSRIHAGAGGYGGQAGMYGSNLAYQSQRIALFQQYELMSQYPLCDTALDIYAQHCILKDEYGKILSIQSDNSEIKDVLHNLFYDILNIEFNLYPWVRNLCKYGDQMLFMEISPNYGVVNVLPLSVYDTVRIEGEKPENPYYVRFESMGIRGNKSNFENYEIAHFRLEKDWAMMPYGCSILESGRHIFQQLYMLQDAMLIQRIMRSADKRIFYLDIGNIAPNEVENFMKKMEAQTKKIPYVDPSTGQYNLNYNMQNMIEDFYIPVRGSDHGTSIENIGGLQYDGIQDVEYVRDLLISALKVPKALLGYEENINGKATLSAQDIFFTRMIERIQAVITSELRKIAVVHLYSQGYTDEDLQNFTIWLTSPSTIYEQEKVNLWQQKVQLIQSTQATKMFSRQWMYTNIFDMHEDDIYEQEKRLAKDAKDVFRLNAIEAGQPDPLKFGYPQNQPMPQPGADGQPAASPGAPPSPDQPAGPGEAAGPQSVDDLPTAADLGLDEDVETRGAPRKGMVYGQDSHPAGRDPLGFKQQYQALKKHQTQRVDKYKSPLSMESVDTIIENSSRLLLESRKGDDGTLLDESILFNFDS